MGKFNKRVAATKTTQNLAGGRAYAHNPEMELVVSVLSTFLKDTYYESGDDRLARIQNLCQLVSDKFLAKLAVVARNDFYLRSVTHVLVGELAKKHRGDDLVKRVIEKTALRPDDLTELVAYLGSPIPKQVKRGVRHALLKFNRYSLAKYKGVGKGVALVDLFNLTHPNPKFATKEQKKAWEDLLEGNLKSEETWESRLSAGEDKTKVWKDLVLEDKIGYMALLRNLRNIEQQADAKTIKMACKMIADPERVKKSKQLPFRFFSAYKEVTNSDMLEAINDALEASLGNVPEMKGITLLAVDGSGSMSGDPITKASMFAAALIKSNKTEFIIYDTSVKPVKVLRSAPALTIAEKIQQEAMGGGTQTSLVFDHANYTRVKYDRIVIISDNESWNEYSVQANYEAYRKTNDIPVYAIDIQGHGTKDIKGGKVRHLTGWSDKLFDFMKWIEKENELVEFINRIEV